MLTGDIKAEARSFVFLERVIASVIEALKCNLLAELKLMHRSRLRGKC